MNRLPLRYALKELKARRGFVAMYVANLTIGLFGFVLLDGFKQAFEDSLEQRSQNLLAADLRISARRLIPEGKAQKLPSVLPPGSQIVQYKSLYGMLRADQGDKLVEINAFEPDYPLYGAFEVTSESTSVQ